MTGGRVPTLHLVEIDEHGNFVPADQPINHAYRYDADDTSSPSRMLWMVVLGAFIGLVAVIAAVVAIWP